MPTSVSIYVLIQTLQVALVKLVRRITFVKESGVNFTPFLHMLGS
jgi:hypothetical protein